MTRSIAKKGLSSTKKIVATTAILLGVGAMVAGGAFAVFTASATGTITAGSGKMFVAMSSTYSISNLAPGDTADRLATITLPQSSNSGDLVSQVKLSLTSANTNGSEVLGHDPYASGTTKDASLLTGANGLKFQIITCDQAWTAPAAPTAPSTILGAYTCAGNQSSPVAAAVFGTDAAATMDLATLSPDSTNTSGSSTYDTTTGAVTLYSLIRLTLPTATNNYEGASTKFTLTANAIQRAGIQK